MLTLNEIKENRWTGNFHAFGMFATNPIWGRVWDPASKQWVVCWHHWQQNWEIPKRDRPYYTWDEYLSVYGNVRNFTGMVDGHR